MYNYVNTVLLFYSVKVSSPVLTGILSKVNKKLEIYL